MEQTETPPPVKELAEYPQSEIGSIASLLPDTPWTTTAVQACERRLATAWVDSADAPQGVAVLVQGDPEGERPRVAYLFGSDAPPDGLVAWTEKQARPLDVVCDDDVGVHLYGAHPEAEIEDTAAHWFERLDAVERPDSSGVRRLRLRDVDAVDELGVPGLLGSFETLKDLLMIGGASGVLDGDRIVSAAFTVDQTVNYARIVGFTVPDRRREGLARASCQHLIATHHEQGRLACALVPAADDAGAALVRALGFEAAARVRRYRLS